MSQKNIISLKGQMTVVVRNSRIVNFFISHSFLSNN